MRFAREKYDYFAHRAHLKSLGISLRPATEPCAGLRATLELGRWTSRRPSGI
jgi:hypothetical protein